MSQKKIFTAEKNGAAIEGQKRHETYKDQKYKIADKNASIAIITLNVNELNHLVKR